MSELVWEAPSPRGRGRWEPLLAQLQTRPGDWARLKDYDVARGHRNCAASTVSYLKRKHPEFEFASRTLGDKRVIYGRFIGNGSES